MSILLVLFRIGEHDYGLDSDQVIEIIPSLELRPLPGSPDYVAGVFNYRGKLIPVIDISTLSINKPCQQRLSTRIILSSYEWQPGKSVLLGLMAEDMTDTLEIEKKDIQDTGIKSPHAPHMGPVINHNDKIIQCILLERMLSPEVCKQLFSGTEK